MMHKVLRLGLAALAVALAGIAGCGKGQVRSESGTRPRVTPVEKLRFTDHVRYHNMGIAWDGDYYYTINGGSTEYSDLNQYGAVGNYVAGYDLSIDGRAIVYSPSALQLYVKPYSTSFEAVDLDLEETSEDLEDVFGQEQSSVAISPEGALIYELAGGEVHVYDIESGDEIQSFALSSYSDKEASGYANAIAASDKFLFVWAPESEKEILVYDLDGNYVARFRLPRTAYGFSLSWANEMLWIAEDADGGEDGADGTWYGYELEGLE